MKQRKEPWESYLGGRKIPGRPNSDYYPAKRQSVGEEIPTPHQITKSNSLADIEHKAEKIAFRAQENTVGMLKRKTYSSFLVKDPREKTNLIRLQTAILNSVLFYASLQGC